MRIEIDKGRKTPAYRQIYEQVKSQIRLGELVSGDILPPERKLAELLGVNRTTVLNAYRELKADGLIASHVGQGTIVCAGDAINETNVITIPRANEPPWQQLFSTSSAAFESHILKDLLTLANRKDIITFATGIASADSGPLEIFRGIEKKILEEKDLRGLLHAPTEGFFSFRMKLCQMMQRRGVSADPEEVMVVSGSQQGIDILARVLLDPGDVVVVEDPSYFPAITAFRAAGARVIAIPLDSDGMRADLLEEALQRYRPKLIYTIPTHQNPTGIDMSLSRRRELISLSNRYRTLILEDDAYGELCYEGTPPPTLKSMDTEGYVIYLSTFSKAVYSGLRIGWMIAHKRLIQRCVSAKQTMDLHSASLSQWVFEPFLGRDFANHVEKMRDEYRQKRDLMTDSLERYAPPGCSWNRPSGGYYIWMTLPRDTDIGLLVKKASEQGVAFVPGYAFYLDNRSTNELRLNFTGASMTDIPEGIRRLCFAIEETIKDSENIRVSSRIEFSPII
jgi:DNA-binding transcriptional MocR family regulator